ncbi:acyltransferase [uncultured Parabacteroides sp.]|uniref:acyltransferase family protein n=1 Tax=uncultured Parabacteroides sp. TaxID=512312 RepID=UPI002595A966|nr:acyltransferase [uncultured Parabacteroides sp.]
MKKHGNRLIWIDWLKVLGMYLIVVGHMFPPGNEFFYVFSVPLFFISSGFLVRREDSLKAFWQKSYTRLVVPAALWLVPIILIYSILDMIRTDISFVGVFVKRCLSAVWGGESALGRMWFIYTLLIVKLVYQILPRNYNRIINIIICIACMIGSQYLSYTGKHYFNSIVNVCLAYPFFYVGVEMKVLKGLLQRLSKAVSLFIAVSCLGITYIALCYNGPTWMYMNDCGSNIILCVLGGVTGTGLIWGISKCIDINGKWLTDLSIGTLVILGLHPILICLCKLVYPIAELGVVNYFTGMVMMVVSLSIIRLCKKRFPKLIGK